MSDRGDAPGRRAHAHPRDVDRLRDAQTSPVTTAVRIDDTPENRSSTVGQVIPTREIKIVNPHTGHLQPRGNAGELRARGYAVMRGYWDEPERTAETIDAAGWIHTGDLATWMRAVTSASSGGSPDLIIRGGENIYPREIEDFLYTHPAIEDVQVIGVPDERFGEQVMAWDSQTGNPSDTGRSARLLHRPNRPFQDPALLQIRRCVSNDGYGEDSEVQDARVGDPGAASPERRKGGHGVNFSLVARWPPTLPSKTNDGPINGVHSIHHGVSPAGVPCNTMNGGLCSSRGGVPDKGGDFVTAGARSSRSAFHQSFPRFRLQSPQFALL